jgi:hypothetical protein
VTAVMQAIAKLPRPIQVGDTVRFKGDPRNLVAQAHRTVRAIHGDFAWVAGLSRSNNAGFVTSLDSLVHADD